jgi:hypothetical protein
MPRLYTTYYSYISYSGNPPVFYGVGHVIDPKDLRILRSRRSEDL